MVRAARINVPAHDLATGVPRYSTKP
jgi:hypothetical protein